MATLLPYDSGHARICGVDLAQDRAAVRRLIGLTVTVERRDAPAALAALRGVGPGEPVGNPDGCIFSLPATDANLAVLRAAAALRERGIQALDIGTNRPSLFKAFLALTGDRLRGRNGRPVRAVVAAAVDGGVLVHRNLIRTRCVPDLPVFAMIQPVMFVVLFAYVFGAAVEVPGVRYRDFLMPGILVQSVAWASAITRSVSPTTYAGIHRPVPLAAHVAGSGVDWSQQQ